MCAGELKRSSIAKSVVFATFLKIERAVLTLESGRAGAVAVSGIVNLIEYKRIPTILLPAVTRCLLGVLCIKYADLWCVPHQA